MREVDQVVQGEERCRDKTEDEHEASIARYVEAWEQDWGPLYTGIAGRLGISLSEAIMFYWVQQSGAQNAMLKAFLNAILSATDRQKEIQERVSRYMDRTDEALDEGEDWKE